MSGRFISFEGIDGAGKSTHVDWCADWLRARGLEVVLTREPGGTPLAEQLRALLLSEPMSIDTETLLVFAARNEHLAQSIRPALARGAWVVCDRFTDSTYAYQGGGRGVSTQRIATLEAWVHADLQPHRSYLFDLPPEVAAQRRAAARAADRFEAEDLAFFERVRGAYQARQAADPQRILTLDARQSVAQLRDLLEADLERLVTT